MKRFFDTWAGDEVMVQFESGAEYGAFRSAVAQLKDFADERRAAEPKTITNFAFEKTAWGQMLNSKADEACKIAGVFNFHNQYHENGLSNTWSFTIAPLAQA